MTSKQFKPLLWIGCVLLASLTGCARDLLHNYGESEGANARQSPAAISIFRNLCDDGGRSSIELRTFSPRAKTKISSMVWMPNSFEMHKPETFEWLDQWLTQGDRTLVYVGRDFSPMADYWSQVSTQLAVQEKTSNAEQPFAVKENIATYESELDAMRSSVRKQVATPWCIFDHSPTSLSQVQSLSGDWADSVDVTKSRIFIRSYPVEYRQNSLANTKSKFDTKSADTSDKPMTQVEFGFKWLNSDGQMLNYIEALQKDDLPSMNVVLATGDGKPLISEISRKSWGSSKVILVTNSSLVSNVSLVNEGNMRIAKMLASTLPKKKMGFVSGMFDPPVRQDDKFEQQKGFEMLTIWPLNVVTLHAVFLGMLMLIAIFPIFGRARRLPQKSTRDFGQHVDAMGGLLYKSQDRFYALSTIADYFRNVRREPTSPWAQLQHPAQEEAKSPFVASESTTGGSAIS